MHNSSLFNIVSVVSYVSLTLEFSISDQLSWDMFLITPGNISKKKSPEEKHGTPLRRDSTTTDPVNEQVKTEELISSVVSNE